LDARRRAGGSAPLREVIRHVVVVAYRRFAAVNGFGGQR
jgi:hypothetical protein